MVRINLLPPEVLEKRTFEQRIKVVAFSGLVVLVVLFGVYGILAMQVGQRNTELQDRQQMEANLQTQAESFAIFEQKETELDTRLELARLALQNRIAWGRFVNELSLVLPADVWLVTLNCDEDAGINVTSRAVDSPNDAPDIGHKAVARTLLRLTDLEQLESVWLDTSTKAEYEEQPVIEFTISASVVLPDGDTEADVAPVNGQ